MESRTEKLAKVLSRLDPPMFVSVDEANRLTLGFYSQEPKYVEACRQAAEYAEMQTLAPKMGETELYQRAKLGLAKRREIFPEA